jgi:hypothetical protein
MLKKQAKSFFAEYFPSAKSLLPSVFLLALGKENFKTHFEAVNEFK